MQLEALIKEAAFSHETDFYLTRLRAIRDDLSEAYDMLADQSEGKEDHFGGHKDENEENDEENETEGGAKIKENTETTSDNVDIENVKKDEL